MKTYDELLAEAIRQHPEETPEQIQRRVEYRVKHLAALQAVALPAKKEDAAALWLPRIHRVLLWIAALLGSLLLASMLKAEPKKAFINEARIMAAAAEALSPSVDVPIIKVSNGGTVLATIPAGILILDCGTNMSCSWTTGTRTFNMAASSTASTAFSALTASANSNVGTFSASGNTWDFSAATAFKFKVGAGSTITANGTTGQVPLSNADGTFTPGDPIVSGPDTTGIAPTKNPVQTGALDNSTACTAGPCVRSFILANGAPAGTEYGLITRNIPSGTQPVSGTFWQATQPISAASLPLPTGAATAAKQPALGTAGTPSADVLTVQGITSMTALKVDGSGVTQPVSGTFWQTTQPVSGTVTANAGTGNFNNASVSATGSAVPASASYIGGNGSGNLKGIIQCDNWTPISLTANTQIITGAASKQTYICSINLVSAAANNVAVVEGTGTVCATSTAGMAGGATAATGWNFAANGGIAQGSGLGVILRTATAADNVCIFVSAANQVSGAISWTQF